MTKESNNAVQSERLMVAVRIRPMEHLSETNKVLSSISQKALVFTEGPNVGDKDPDHFSKLYFPQPPPTAQTMRPSRASNSNSNLNSGPLEGKVYEFDHVFDQHASQEEVYLHTTAPLVKSVFDGFCATVFAYGATSSGKTYSMVGTPSHPGIMKRSIDDVFLLCAQHPNTKTEVYLSYLEIYNEKIRDLLHPIPGVHLELREDTEQVHVSGLSEVRATSTSEVLSLLQKGNRARTMEPTAANITSSRSHAILLVTVRQFTEDEREMTDGKLYLIDLAGSERASQTKNSGLRLREGGHINRSLLALGNCITALAAGEDKYINYRDSKLTRLLKAALGGPSKTVMIAHVSPSIHQREETRNTLLYGQRARAISNRVRKFIYPGQSSETGYIITELRNEVKRLQTKLEQRNTNTSTLRNYPAQNPQPNHPNPFYHEGYIDKHEKEELLGVKQQISSLFDEEFRLRNDLLRLDGAMLQSALDCEILRLMVLDWENLKSVNKEEREERDSSEIHSVMRELKEVRVEQDKLLRMRNEVEVELRRVRGKIGEFEEEASHYLPEVQREILSLLCKLQQEQLNKMSVEIEAELKRRGSLLLRCLRQKALGEAIIHRQRHFLSAISGSLGGNRARFLPPLLNPANPTPSPPGSHGKPSSGEKAFGLTGMREEGQGHLPPLGSVVPKTTKYSDFRQQRLIQRQLLSSSEEDYEERWERDRFPRAKSRSPYPPY